MPNWIPTHALKPDPATAVLVVIRDRDDGEPYIELGELDNDVHWYLVGAADELFPPPSHWMPLPDLPDIEK